MSHIQTTGGFFWKDYAERLLWTIAEVVVATLITFTADLPPEWWVPILTTLLMAAKGLIGKAVGNKNTASIGGPSDTATTP